LFENVVRAEAGWLFSSASCAAAAIIIVGSPPSAVRLRHQAGNQLRVE